MHNTRYIAAIYLLICGLFFSLDARSEQDLRAIHSELLESINLLKDKKYAQACVKLKLLPSLDKADTDPIAKQLRLNINYIQGQCFAGLGLYEDAKTYFKILIEEDPDQARPYLDLAIIYQYLGEFELAEDIYQQVLELNSLESGVRKKVEAMRKVNPEKIQYGVELTTGLLVDNNLVNSPSSASVVIYGKEFFFNENLRPTEATGVYVGANASVSKLLDNDKRLSLQMNIASSNYLNKPDGNTLLVDFIGGYHAKWGESEYAIEPRFASVSIGGESLLNITSIGARYTTFLNNNIRLSPMLEYSSYQYTSAFDRSADIIKPQVLVNYSYNQNLMFIGVWALNFASAKESQNSYTGSRYEMGVRYRYNSNLLFGIDYSLNTLDFDKQLEAFDEKRADTRHAFNINSSLNLKGLGFPRLTLDVGVNHFQNDSNIDLYTNNRTQFYSLIKYTAF